MTFSYLFIFLKGKKAAKKLFIFSALHFFRKIKEVIQPQVPLRLPCDDLTHLTEPRFGYAKERILT